MITINVGDGVRRQWLNGDLVDNATTAAEWAEWWMDTQAEPGAVAYCSESPSTSDWPTIPEGYVVMVGTEKTQNPRPSGLTKMVTSNGVLCECRTLWTISGLHDHRSAVRIERSIRENVANVAAVGRRKIGDAMAWAYITTDAVPEPQVPTTPEELSAYLTYDPTEDATRIVQAELDAFHDYMERPYRWITVREVLTGDERTARNVHHSNVSKHVRALLAN